MKKIINNLATIEYKIEFNGVEVDFQKDGDITSYDETMALSLKVAAMNGLITGFLLKVLLQI